MSIKHIILCIEFVFLAVQLIKISAKVRKNCWNREHFSTYRYTAVQHSNHSFKYYGVRWHECLK